MLRGCFDPVDSAPHLDHVCIQLQDAPLRQQRLHPDRVVRFQSFPDPGAGLPEEDRPGALVRDRGSSTNRSPFPLRFFHREVFEKYLQALLEAKISPEVISRLRATLLEDKSFTERALKDAVF